HLRRREVGRPPPGGAAPPPLLGLKPPSTASFPGIPERGAGRGGGSITVTVPEGSDVQHRPARTARHSRRRPARLRPREAAGDGQAGRQGHARVPEVPGLDAGERPRHRRADRRADHARQQHLRRRPPSHQHLRRPAADGEQRPPAGTFGHYAPVEPPAPTSAAGAPPANGSEAAAPPPAPPSPPSASPPPSPGGPSESEQR